MSYVVLARKWRPQDFSSVIGQEPIITALRNGLKENRIAQAERYASVSPLREMFVDMAENLARTMPDREA